LFDPVARAADYFLGTLAHEFFGNLRTSLPAVEASAMASTGRTVSRFGSSSSTPPNAANRCRMDSAKFFFFAFAI
jgi:hypothetical protein